MQLFNARTTRKKSGFLQAGFTLIELLVTISIIGALSALLVTNFISARGRASDAKKKSELNSLKSALRLFYNDYQNYPAGSGLIDPGTGNLLPGDAFVSGASTYMKALPASYWYYASTPFDSFVLYTKLSNLSDEDIQASFTKCCTPVRTGCPTEVTNEYLICED
jgi:prepilin-type N-terminal cleavage/methylation domain-containing protein